MQIRAIFKYGAFVCLCLPVLGGNRSGTLLAARAAPYAHHGQTGTPPSANSASPQEKSGSTPPLPAAPVVPLQAAPIVLPARAQLPQAISYHTWNGLPIADLAVNGDSRATFALDTGLNANAVTPAEATRLNLTKQPLRARVNILDRESVGDIVWFKSISIGEVALANVPAAAVDVAALISPKLHPDAPAGWLGTPFFSAFLVSFDFPANLLTLNKPQARLPEGQNVVSVPLTLREGRPYVMATIQNSKPFAARVDTGVVITLVPGAVADKLKLIPLQTLPIVSPDGRAGRMILARLPEINVDKAIRKNMVVAYVDKAMPGGLDPNMAVLGIDFLEHFKVTLSYSRKRMLLIPPAPPPVNPNEGGDRIRPGHPAHP